MERAKDYKGSVADRLERLPFSKFHRNFLLMLTSGEWAESLMLLGNGAILGLVAAYFAIGGLLSEYALPAFFFVGEFVGSIFFGRLADRRGRRTVFLYNQLLFGGGMLVAGFMPSWELVGIFVFIGGIGVGGEFPLVDSYGTEIFKGKHRGSKLAVIYTIAATAGPFILYISSLTRGLGFFSFRIPLWIMGIAGFTVWAIRLRLPESPRWLEMQGRYKEADEIMKNIEERVKRDEKLSELPPVERETPIITKKSSYAELFRGDTRRTVIMMLIFQFFQSGIFYGFVTFAPGIMIHSFRFNNPLGFGAIIFSGFVVGSIVNIFIIDKIERKWGIIGFAILGGIFGTLFVAVHTLLGAVVLGFLTTFSLWNFSNFMHQYQGEIFPTRLRTTAAGLTYSLSRISTAILVLFIAAFIKPLGNLAIFYFIWLLVAICVVDLIVLGPHTTRRVVEEIAQ